MKRKAYIAGPMSGYDNLNYPAFDFARGELSRLGYHAISPADIDRLYEGPEFETVVVAPTTEELKRFMRRDLLLILDLDPCTDIIYMLRGWELSKGANVEIALARFLGLEIVYEVGVEVVG